jgi:hypothetical protein
MGVLMNLSPVLADGVNAVFMLGNNADLDHLGTPAIYVAGVLKTVTVDYTISGYTVTFGSAPAAGALIQGDYSTLDRN